MEAQADLYAIIRSRLVNALEGDNAETAMEGLVKWWADLKASEANGCWVPVPEPVYSPEDIPLRPAYQQRVLDEKAALDEKIDKLTEFLSDPPVKLPAAESKRLAVQLGFMCGYSTVLAERIAAF